MIMVPKHSTLLYSVQNEQLIRVRRGGIAQKPFIFFMRSFVPFFVMSNSIGKSLKNLKH